MNSSDNASKSRPLIIGVIIGLVVGLIIGLAWAWMVQPAFYEGGAYPNEMSDSYQQSYVQTVSEAYMTTQDVVLAADRLRAFSEPKKVELLATAYKNYQKIGRMSEAGAVLTLAKSLQQHLSWSDEIVSDGLTDANADATFATALGQVPREGAAQEVTQTEDNQADNAPEANADEDSGGTNWGKILLILFVVILALALIYVMLNRLAKSAARSRRTARPIPSQDLDLVDDDGSTLTAIRQWTSTYSLGSDNYDESFAIEDDTGKFIGECGVGILDGFASGNPKRVLALDVWLFDKTDIRTISMPIMSPYAFNDEVVRSKLPRSAEPILAVEGNTFNLNTTSLMVKAKIEEADFGDGAPEDSYFTSLKVSLIAYLKDDADISGDMPIPDEYA